MAESTQWSFPRELQPRTADVAFDLRTALDAVVMLRANVPEDAFTASILGTERAGNGVVIRDDGLTLTIGYLITEAESVWLTTNSGATVAGHPLAYDFASGFGLVVPLGKLDAPSLARGSATTAGVDDDVFVVGHGGLAHALKARVIAKREFAGYWEYLLDEALFTAPPHPEWSGAALLDDSGRLLGVGSLLVQEAVGEDTVQGNMFVPVDLLTPLLDDLLKSGRSTRPPHPWLGMYTTEIANHLVVNGLARHGPADTAGVRLGDIVVDVAGERVSGLADFYRKVWRLGPPGTRVPLTLARDGAVTRTDVKSADRGDFLKKPQLQ
ncbi:MAG: serine protease [Betaproteobacteria bacterium]|nr:MAG: serine protease [Betaproteobacteria bacterium]TMH66647.1 MAG: serine protease [Betaproteobacteria bacterium]